jgi:hypothetical protein
MTRKTKAAAKSQPAKSGTKKLTLKRETLTDLSPREAQAAHVRGQSTRFGQGDTNHNETLVRVRSQEA